MVVHVVDRHDLCTIGDNDLHRIPCTDEDVSRFEVSVEAVQSVEVFNGLRNLKHDLQSILSC